MPPTSAALLIADAATEAASAANFEKQFGKLQYGEPIVETPRDAVNCFLSTGIDYLAIHDLMLRKSQLNWITAPARRFFSDVANMAARSGVDVVK